VTNEEGLMPKRKKKKTRPAPQSATTSHAESAAEIVSSKSDSRLESRLLVAALLTATFVWSCSPMMGFDIWWHLKTGQLILERQTLPFVDWFTYSDSEAAWVDLHWGFQLLAAATYAAGGVALLVLAKAALITATVAVGTFATREKLECCVRVGVWSLVAIILTGRGIVRPEILSLMFLAAWLAILLKADARPSLLWLLPPMLIVWVNCHALFVFGLVVFACWAFDCALRHAAAGRWGLTKLEEETAGAQQIIIVGALLAVACLFNPYFEEGALFPLVLFRKLSVDEAFYSVRVDEFTSPAAFFGQIGLRSLHLDAAAVLWLLAAASFLWLGMYRRVSVFRGVLFVAFSYLGFKMIRNLSPAAIVSGVVLCENLSEAFRLRNAFRASSTAESAEDSRRKSGDAKQRRCAIALSVILFGLATSHFSGHWGRLTGLGDRDRFGLGEATAWYSHGAAKFAGQPGFPDRAIIASFGQAAVYEFHNAPTRRVLMDGRLEVCTRETFELYESILSRMSQGDPGWQQLPGVADAQGRLPAIILDSRTARNEINGMFQLSSWRMVFADSAAAVFISSDLADQLGLPPVDPAPLMRPPS
jgi:hypothetical protein